MSSVDFGHSDRSAVVIGLEQHTPLVVTFAGEQQAPLAVGMRPDAQHSGPTGMWKIGWHVFLSGPGASPVGQQTPVEVTLLVRQQAPPARTYPTAQTGHPVLADPGWQFGVGGRQRPLTSGPLQHACAPPGAL